MALNRHAPIVTYERKVSSMIASTMMALLITNPLDMIATRLTC